MRTWIRTLVAAGLGLAALAQPSGAGKLLGWERVDGAVRLRYERACAEVETLNGGALHWTFAYAPALPPRHSYAVVARVKDPSGGVQDAGSHLRLSIPGGEIRIAREGLGLEVYRDGRLRFAGEGLQERADGAVRVRLKPSRERYYGLGCKTGPLELTGRTFVNDNTDAYGYGWTSDPLYTTIPFFLAVGSDSTTGVFVDSPARTEFDFRPSAPSFAAHEPWMETYVFSGDTKGVMAAYTRLTGRPYLPPLWAFGFHQSRYSYLNEAEVMAVADGFKAADLPLDAIHLDIDFLDRKRSFTHDRTAFPDPQAMNRALRLRGLRTVVIADPAIPRDPEDPVFRSGDKAGVFLRKDGAYYEGKVWPGVCVFPDFTKAGIEDWWGPLYADSLAWGIAGFWNDMNEPAIFNERKTMDPAVAMSHQGLGAHHGSLHNAYGLAMAKATHLGLAKLRPTERVFLLSRAGYAGIQRYAFLWSGDNTAAWDHLRMNVTMAASMGLSGAPYFGADIGGYVGNPTGELMLRWIQAATFVPFMRDHTGKGNAPHEPYAFPNELPYLRKYLKLRYALLPYLYTAAWRASTEGEPINRPLFYDFGPSLLGVESGFLFGRDLLVYPVFEPRAKALEAVFPKGLWYSLFDRKRYAAGTVTLPVTREDIPVFVRGGSILPLASHAARNTDELRARRDLRLGVYPDAKGWAEGFLYEDDGLTTDFQKGLFLKSRFQAQSKGGVLEFTLDQEGGFAVTRKLELEVPSDIESVRFQGQLLPVRRGRVQLTP